jgi:hypothetical protein
MEATRLARRVRKVEVTVHGVSDQLATLDLRYAMSTEQPGLSCSTDDTSLQHPPDGEDQSRWPRMRSEHPHNLRHFPPLTRRPPEGHDITGDDGLPRTMSHIAARIKQSEVYFVRNDSYNEAYRKLSLKK